MGSFCQNSKPSWRPNGFVLPKSRCAAPSSIGFVLPKLTRDRRSQDSRHLGSKRVRPSRWPGRNPFVAHKPEGLWLDRSTQLHQGPKRALASRKCSALVALEPHQLGHGEGQPVAYDILTDVADT